MSLRKFSWRSLRQRPGRTILTVLSIIIGVATTVSFAVVTASTRDAYRNMFSLVTGRTSLEISAPGDNRFSADVAKTAAATPGVEVAAPTVRRMSTLFAKGQRANLQVLGVDPALDRRVRDYDIIAGRMLEDEADMLLDKSMARRFDIQLNDEVKLLTDRKLQKFTVVGLLEPQGGTALRQAGLVLITLPRAQHVFKATGKLDLLQVVARGGVDIDQLQETLQRAVGDELQVRPPSTNSQMIKETLNGSEQGLRLASLFSLLLAAFIILNTFLMNVSERRRQLAILRAIGATSRQIRTAIVGESLLLGTTGTIVGIVAGLLLARVINSSMSEILRVEVPIVDIGLKPYLMAVIFGMGMSVAGAYVPARRAGAVSPLEGLDRVARSDLEGVSWRYLAAGLVLTIVSTTVIVGGVQGWLPLIWPTYAAVFLLLGIVMLSPLVLAPLATVVAYLLRPVLKLEGRLALKQILRHRTRSTLTAGVLFVATSSGIGIAYAILDNIDDVRDWYRKAFVGDFFVRAMIPDTASGEAADLPTELYDELKAIPYITNLEAAVMVASQIGETKVIIVARDFTDPYSMGLDLVSGDETKLRQQLRDGQIVIGSVLGMRLGLKQDDDVELTTSEGVKKFHVCGVANDYTVGGYSLYLDRSYAVKWFGAEGVDGFGVRSDPKHRDEVQAALQKLCDEHGVLLHSFADVVRQIEFMISGIVSCLWGLIVLGFVVGAFGVVNTLTMNVLEQTRELGMLRIIAMTRGQVRRTIVTQALIMAGVGLAPGVVGGLVTAWVMNIATMPSIGHPVEFGFRPWLVLGAMGGALAICVVAAWIPARRAARLDVVQALQYE